MNFLDFFTLLANMIAAAQSASSVALDTSVGSILRAILQATGSVALWLQSLIAALLQSIRAATATGSALDSWMADFGLTRIGAVSAQTTLTFARFSTGAAAFIPVGSIAQTSDGTVQFAVIADPTNPAYSATSNGYTVTAGVPSINVLAQASTSGAAGNVGAGLINTLGQAIPYIDTVTNASAAAGGADAETDAAFRARFVLYIGSLSKATLVAIKAAASGVGSNITYTIVENYNPAGPFQPGMFYITADDGSGAIPTATLNAIYAAVDAVRAFTVTFMVLAATKLTANVSATIGINPAYSSSGVLAAVSAAVTSFINSLPVGSTLYYTQLANAIYQASPGVLTVKVLTINGATLDITPTPQQVVRAGTVAVVSG